MIYFSRNVNLDNILSNETLNISNNSGFSEHPHIASSGNNTYLVWVDNSNGHKQVFLLFSENAGETFRKSLILSNDNVNASNVIFIQMINMSSLYGNNLILLILRLLCGLVIIWVSPLAAKPCFQVIASDSYPKVFADENNVYITWNVDNDNRFKPRVVQEQEGLPDYKPGIYFIKSEDLGKSFSSPVRFDYNDSFDNGKSQVSAFDKYVYITWVHRDSVNKLGNLFTAKKNGW